MNEFSVARPGPTVWPVGVLCRAIAESLDARFNPVSVAGEVSGFSRAASGHCYFVLKDDSGQIRCAMFRRAAGSLDFSPRDGDLVEVRGRLGVYEPRGELQLVVEGMRRAGQGGLFEQFVRLKTKLEAEGLFDAARKRALPPMPRGIGIVTSLGAAALHDVATALQRRVPHIPVVLVHASVQGESAPAELMLALQKLYAMATMPQAADIPAIDLILLVRGGGSLEDLWAFNDEALARVIAQSPVPVVAGVGHETDFTIADFVADLRAPTPTAAAELACQAAEVWLARVEDMRVAMSDALTRWHDRSAQRLDRISAQLGRPSDIAARQNLQLARMEQGLAHGLQLTLRSKHTALQRLDERFPIATKRALRAQSDRLSRAESGLQMLDPSLVLRRGYAWLSQEDGKTLTSVRQTQAGQKLRATLADGGVDLTVRG
jgi:exodeoxyribonuclease VII large subunit